MSLRLINSHHKSQTYWKLYTFERNLWIQLEWVTIKHCLLRNVHLIWSLQLQFPKFLTTNLVPLESVRAFMFGSKIMYKPIFKRSNITNIQNPMWKILINPVNLKIKLDNLLLHFYLCISIDLNEFISTSNVSCIVMKILSTRTL